MSKSIKPTDTAAAPVVRPQDTFIPTPPASKKDLCGVTASKLEDYFNKLMASKVNKLEHCGEHDDDCPCSGGGSTPKVDLIVLIDPSGSMSSFATDVSDAAKSAIDKAKDKCVSDLKVTYLGVDGATSGTIFTISHRDYITDLPGAVPLAADVPPVGSLADQGANAIQDLSKYAEWRNGACRAIFTLVMKN
ncbi:MAG: hypothetical protein IPM82_13500 [Saprospiraceae bacterium]|nr:hypothetical protein [Saprospiraceae bacterium]